MTFPIGTTFQPVGRKVGVCTVVDIWKTYNSAGELVKTRYVATHQLGGQTVTDCDVVGVTIARGLIALPK